MKRFILLFTVLAFPIATFAAEAETPANPTKPSAPAEPAKAAEPAGEVKTHAPTDLAALKPLKGQKILLEGKIVNVGANKTDSIRYLNFTKNFRESVSLVFFANSGGGTFTKEALAKFVGKTVRVNGTLSEYNDALQIRIESLDQVKVIEEAPVTPPVVAPEK